MIVRWITEDGSKKWIYPVKKDLSKGQKIVKQVTTRAKIIGVTKVNIPSPMHPTIPYYILLLEDEHGNRLPKKTMKEYRIGDIYDPLPAKSKDAVVITKVKYDVGEYLKDTLRLLGDTGLSPGDKVVVTPSVMEPAYPYQASTTSPELLGHVLSWLKDNGITDIIVAGQALPGNDTLASAKKSGILGVCQKAEVPVVDLSKSEYEERVEDDMTFRIAKDILGRKIINLPAMKTSVQIGICGAMENLTRLADPKTIQEMYYEGIDKTLPSLLKVLPQGLHIGDALIGLHGNGPLASGGEPAFLNTLLASKDPVALDAVFVHLSGSVMPRYIIEAGSRGIGKNDIKTLEIVGDELEATQYPLKLPKEQPLIHPYMRLIDGKADPATFVAVTSMTGKMIGLAGEEIQIAVGRHLTKEMLVDKDRLVAFGKDAIDRLKELKAEVIAELPESMDKVEKMVLLKSVLQDPKKRRITLADKMRSKFASMASKIQGAS